MKGMEQKFSQISVEKRESEPVIVNIAIPEDAEGIGKVLYETWLATYPNEEAGITREVIESVVSVQLDPEYIVERAKKIAEIDPAVRLFLTAKVAGTVQGIATANKYPDGRQKIGSLYVLPEAQGKGVGAALAQRMLDWFDLSEPVHLTVATYNVNAIHFYERFGFEVTDEEVQSEAATLPNGKVIPEVAMLRKALVAE